MLGMILAVALQAAAPAAPAGAQATPEQRTRLALASRGMSQAGASLRSIAERGQAAEQNLRAALAKRPVDVEAFVAANTARGEASSALQREAVMVANEQMRALSPADRVVLSQIAVSASQPPRQPAKSQPKR